MAYSFRILGLGGAIAWMPVSGWCWDRSGYYADLVIGVWRLSVFVSWRPYRH